MPSGTDMTGALTRGGHTLWQPSHLRQRAATSATANVSVLHTGTGPAAEVR